MSESLYRELVDRLAKDPRLTKRGGPRVDLSLLLFNARADLEALWVASERLAQTKTAPGALTEAVERLRPLFGPR